ATGATGATGPGGNTIASNQADFTGLIPGQTVDLDVSCPDNLIVYGVVGRVNPTSVAGGTTQAALQGAWSVADSGNASSASARVAGEKLSRRCQIAQTAWRRRASTSA